MLSFIKKSIPCLGIYVNSKAINWCRLEFAKRRAHIIEHGSIEFDMQSSWDPIASLAKPKERVILGLPPSKVIVKNITMPTKLTTQTIIEYLKNNDQQIFKEKHSQLSFDFTQSPIDSEFCQLQVAACKQSLIDSLQKYFSYNKLTLLAVEPALLALSRLEHATLHNQTLVYIFIDQKTMCCYAYHAGRYLSHTTQVFHINNVTLNEMIARQLDALTNNYPQINTAQIYLILDEGIRQIANLCLPKRKVEYLQINKKMEVIPAKTQTKEMLPGSCVLPACLALRGMRS